jgi:hypothetical protein
LVRLQFDANDLLQARYPLPMKCNALTMALSSHLVKSGLRQIEHPMATEPNASKRVRKTISLSTGFRKHVISTFIEAGLNHEIRELIVDHSTQVSLLTFSIVGSIALSSGGENSSSTELVNGPEEIRDPLAFAFELRTIGV